MRKRVLIASASVIIITILTVVVWPGEKEPEYDGASLSHWVQLDRVRTGIGVVGSLGRQFLMFSTAHNPKRDEALRQIGTNALPFLVKWVGYTRPTWKTRAANACSSCPSALINKSLKSWLTYSTREQIAEGSVSAFSLLGTNAAPAVPELLQKLQHTKNDATIQRLFLALGSIGPPAKDALPYLSTFTNDRASTHYPFAMAATQNIENKWPPEEHLPR